MGIINRQLIAMNISEKLFIATIADNADALWPLVHWFVKTGFLPNDLQAVYKLLNVNMKRIQCM